MKQVLLSMIFLCSIFSANAQTEAKSNTKKLKIVATIIAKPEFKEDIVKVLHTVTDATRKEEGNISYVLHRDTDNDLKFIILEEWKSQETIDFHNKTAHFLTLKKELDEKADLLTIDVIQEVY
ncbi:MAG: putative quinol monooxygenase [Breznakibacter sp.]